MFNNDILPTALSQYLQNHSEEEPPLLQQIREKTEQEMHQPHMMSGVHQGRFLSLISKLVAPNRIIEIGTFTGYATLCLAEGLTKNGTLITLDRDTRLQAFYQEFFNRSDKSKQIQAITTEALAYLQNYTGETIDLVFLDANKRKYIDYLEAILPHMKKGGLILADNVLWKNKVLKKIDLKDKMTQSLHEFNTFVKQHPKVEAVMLPIRDGITLIRKI